MGLLDGWLVWKAITRVRRVWGPWFAQLVATRRLPMQQHISAAQFAAKPGESFDPCPAYPRADRGRMDSGLQALFALPADDFALLAERVLQRLGYTKIRLIQGQSNGSRTMTGASPAGASTLVRCLYRASLQGIPDDALKTLIDSMAGADHGILAIPTVAPENVAAVAASRDVEILDGPLLMRLATRFGIPLM